MAKGTTSGTPVPSYRTTNELGADSKTDTIGFESSVLAPRREGYGYRPESTFTGHGLLNQSDNRFTTSKTENPMIEESTAAPALTPIKRSEHEPDFEDSRAEASLTHEYKKPPKKAKQTTQGKKLAPTL